jgi:hypothetical protein
VGDLFLKKFVTHDTIPLLFSLRIVFFLGYHLSLFFPFALVGGLFFKQSWESGIRSFWWLLALIKHKFQTAREGAKI